MVESEPLRRTERPDWLVRACRGLRELVNGRRERDPHFECVAQMRLGKKLGLRQSCVFY